MSFAVGPASNILVSRLKLFIENYESVYKYRAVAQPRYKTFIVNIRFNHVGAVSNDCRETEQLWHRLEKELCGTDF